MARYRTAVAAVICATALLGAAESLRDIVLYGADMGDVPLGARQAAMGRSGIVLPLSAMSSYANPAACGFLDHHEVWIEGATLYGGFSRQAGVAAHLPLQHDMGLSAVYAPFFSGDIYEFDSLPGSYEERLTRPELRADGSSAGLFHNNHHRAVLAVGKRFSWGLPRPAGFGSTPLPLEVSAGCSFVSYWQTITPGEKVRMGLNVNMDLGMTASLGVDYDLERKVTNRSVLIGTAFHRVLPTEVMWVHSPSAYREPVYSSQHFGAAYLDDKGILGGTWTISAAIRRSPHFAVVETDSTLAESDFALAAFFGIEGEFWESIAFRLGLADGNPSLGAGIRYGTLRIDYALSFDEIGVSPVRLSLGVIF